MPPRKLSQSSIGEWGIDAFEMPVITLDPARCFLHTPPPAHKISTGAFAAVVDATGRVCFIDQSGSTPIPLNAPARSAAGAFYLRLTHQQDDRLFLLSNVAIEENPRLEWGVAHVTQAAELNFSTITLNASLTIAAPPQAEFVFVELTLTNPNPAAVTIDILATAELSLACPPERSLPVFKMNPVAMFTETDELKRDFFIAGPENWQASRSGSSLHVQNACEVAPAASVTCHFIVGLRSDCTMDWVRGQFRELSLETIRNVAAAPLTLTFPRFPEIWMREECVWDVSRLLTGSHGQAPPHGLEPPSRLDPPIVRSSSDRAESVEGLRDILRLSLPLTYIDPELAANNLIYATRRLQPAGCLSASEAGKFQPETDVSDLEVWLILGWCHLLTITGDFAPAESVLIQDGSERPLQRILEKAFSWIETSIGTGAHGLLRMGAGDGLRLLSRAGVHGSGESVTLTAQFIHALELWLALEPQLTQRPSPVVAQARQSAAALKQAVADAFHDTVFIRAFTDAGTPVGDGDNRWFSDAQSWSLLAGCGTASQREKAVSALMRMCENTKPATIVSKPYQLPPPHDIVPPDCPLPGYGENGGVDAFNEACLIWALAETGAREEAAHIWRRFSLRGLMVHDDMPPFLSASARGALPAHLFSSLPRVNALTGDQPAPDTACLSWKHFALCKTLS
ncbi:MAG: hypothetical protein RRC34_04595 [Lentisphaeria bacterium]|nr:hypothetical protein [Lentisphaeria bacterium]